MKGDYWRYIAEYASGAEKDGAAKEAEKAYDIAHKEATTDDNLSSTHPLRLGLALNYSVYHYEIK